MLNKEDYEINKKDKFDNYEVNSNKEVFDDEETEDVQEFGLITQW